MSRTEKPDEVERRLQEQVCSHDDIYVPNKREALMHDEIERLRAENEQLHKDRARIISDAKAENEHLRTENEQLRADIEELKK